MTHKSIDFVDDINSKYSTLEYEIDQKLQKISVEEEKLEKSLCAKHVTFERSNQMRKKDTKCTNLLDAKKRNGHFIKELEIVKARLRSKATFSPLEDVLSKAISNYVQNISLSPGTIATKTYGPTFV